MHHPDALEARIQEFEAAWQKGQTPDIRLFLAPTPADELERESRLALLIELIAIDLEFRWRLATGKKHTGRPWQLDSYLLLFPELGSLDQLPLVLVGEEYRVRHRWGDRPQHHSFVDRFADRRDQILQVLLQIDRELQTESGENLGAPPELRNAAADNTIIRSQDPRTPLTDADFLLERHLGTGGMGKVYRALQRSLERRVAVKFLKKQHLSDSRIVDQFIEEAKLIAKLRHPGIVGVHGIGRTARGNYFIVMDLVQGKDLSKIIDEGIPALKDVIRWVAAAAVAVEHAHSRGIIHCDLKPSNILLDGDRNIWITDFGLARRFVDEARIASGPAGTAAFMAPEQLAPEWGELGPWTDIYGLGGVLFSLLTGHPPYSGRRTSEILSQVISAAPINFSECDAESVPEPMQTICLKALAKRPEDRYSSAEEFAAALSAGL